MKCRYLFPLFGILFMSSPVFSQDKRGVVVTDNAGNKTFYPQEQFSSVEFAVDSDEFNGDEINAVKLTQENGVVSYYFLSDKPIITMDEGSVTLTTDKEEIEFNEDEVLTFEFTRRELAGLNELENNGVVFNFTENAIEIYGLSQGEQVVLTDLSGKTLSSAISDPQGNVNISLNNAANGIYILHSNGTTFKFRRK